MPRNPSHPPAMPSASHSTAATPRLPWPGRPARSPSSRGGGFQTPCPSPTAGALPENAITGRRRSLHRTLIASATLTSLTLTATSNEALDLLEDRGGGTTRPTTTETRTPTATASITPDPEIYQPPPWAASALDPLWQRAVLFDNPENPWLQRVALTGMFDWQFASGSADIDPTSTTPSRSADSDGSLTRRARLGARIRAFNNTDIEAAAEFAGPSRFNGIERLAIQTEIVPNTTIRIGKFRPSFTNDFIHDPERSPYPDRALITNLVAPNRTAGVMLGHTHHDWEFGLGWFTNDTASGMPGIRSDGLLVANIARNYNENAGEGLLRARWNLDLIHNLDGTGSRAMPRHARGGATSENGGLPVIDPGFRHALAAGVALEQDRFAFIGDFVYAKGDTGAWGLNLSPSWWAVPGTLRVVGRYQYAGSDTHGGLVTALGPANDPLRATSPLYAGDTFHSFYLGANLHLHQDRLLIMAGFERIILEDGDNAASNANADAMIWRAGARLSF